MITLQAAHTYETDLLHTAETDTICGEPYGRDLIAKIGQQVEMYRRLLLTHDAQAAVCSIRPELWEQVRAEVEVESLADAFGDWTADYLPGEEMETVNT